MDKSDPEKGIYKVYATMECLIKGTSSFHSIYSDLIFLEGKPMLVLEWVLGKPVTVGLDPTRLKKLAPHGEEYLYDGPIKDPRTMN